MRTAAPDMIRQQKGNRIVIFAGFAGKNHVLPRLAGWAPCPLRAALRPRHFISFHPFGGAKKGPVTIASCNALRCWRPLNPTHPTDEFLATIYLPVLGSDL